jgi:hypothetical protein
MDLIARSTSARVHGELFIPRRKPRHSRLMTAGTAEYLDQRFRSIPLYCEFRLSGPRLRPFRVFHYLERVLADAGSVGFKLMYSNLVQFPEVWVWAVLRRLRVVHLVRENHLDVAISSAVRFATRTVHRVAGEPEPPPVQIRLDPGALLRSMRRSRRSLSLARKLLRWSPLPSHEVRYEALTADNRAFEAVCRFLEMTLRDCVPESRLQKVFTRSHREILLNYQEIRAALLASEFASLID